MEKIIKMKYLFFVVLAMIGSLTFFLQSCDEPKPNPCIGKELLNADFTIGQRIKLDYVNGGGIDTLIRTDTILIDYAAQFEAKHDNMTYEWKIGEDPRTWNTKKVSLAFRNFSGSVTIRLIGRWTPNLQCFPKDDGVDTVYHTLTVVEDKDNPVFGEFEGYNLSNKSDIFRIKLFLNNAGYVILNNVNRNCQPTVINGEQIPFDGIISYRRYFFTGYDNSRYGGCLEPRGVMVVSGSGKSVIVNFSTIKSSSDSKTRIKDTFIGNRIE